MIEQIQSVDHDCSGHLFDQSDRTGQQRTKYYLQMDSKEYLEHMAVFVILSQSRGYNVLVNINLKYSKNALNDEEISITKNSRLFVN